MEFRSSDHPEANGRKPIFGEQEWTITVNLESGENLKLRLGKETYTNIRKMFEQMDIDDDAEMRATGN